MRGLTVTPRQRIAGARELARLTETKAPPQKIADFRQSFLDVSIDSCAACGLCEGSCPVGINTGLLTKSIRGQVQSPFGKAVASLAGHHYHAATNTVRLGLSAASALDFVTAGYGLDAVGIGLAKMTAGRAPVVSHRATPRAAHTIERFETPPGEGSRPIVFFSSCATRMFGPARDDAEGEDLSVTLLRLFDKAGLTVITPPRHGSLCCGQPFDSQGLSVEADRKADEVIDVLVAASNNGRWPVLIDTSPCSLRLKERAVKHLAILDIAEFLHDYVLPNVAIPVRSAQPVALHLTCSTRRMGLDAKLTAVARACADNVVIPPDIGCCGFAGDKGFTRPDMNAHALRTLAPAVAGCTAGYSSSRTCEIGLSVHGAIPYRSIAHLLDAVCVAPVTQLPPVSADQQRRYVQHEGT